MIPLPTCAPGGVLPVRGLTAVTVELAGGEGVAEQRRGATVDREVLRAAGAEVQRARRAVAEHVQRAEDRGVVQVIAQGAAAGAVRVAVVVEEVDAGDEAQGVADLVDRDADEIEGARR